jgi:hypothetical protein
MFFGGTRAAARTRTSFKSRSLIGKFTPSFTAVAFNIRGSTKQKTFSGFEIRPLKKKKKKKGVKLFTAI